ncbi:MAG TPA: isoprenyl transferase [Candidatus Omnitrophota bacterium]|nr:isoprenyl transferase [Candidatus Omnitrophota bacterium]HPD85006.1 isoprenyl transferase [Candidatus Omnitrophota bacterium]HRZ03864.1 isoprenyl transferase [Candidatus Omnitrophota bacterium]
MKELNSLPVHVAIIMDGNGRWARQRRLLRTQGHLEGVKRVEEVIKSASDMGIKVLTLFTFSTENWNRPKDEVSILMKTLISVLNKKARELNRANIRLQSIGRREGVPTEVLKTIDAVRKLTQKNTGMILNIAFNYGGRCEIIDAVKKIADKVKGNKMSVQDIDEEVFNKALYTAGLPDPDLLIRTSGEKRISNFLLWQLSYAELYFTDKFWPDFNKAEFDKAIEDFRLRERRYGNINSSKG